MKVKTCRAGHPLHFNAVDYETPRWVHDNAADLITCPAIGDDPE